MSVNGTYMSRSGILGFIVFLAASGAAVLWLMAPPEELPPNPVEHFATYPDVDFSKAKDPELAKKGLYLTKLGDCIACHTANAKEPFAGGRAINSPFGTFYSPNITSDKEHGLGKWTFEEFKNSMRHGYRPNGANLFPVFPYLYYTKVTDEDLVAMKAYFDIIPPIPKKNKPHDVPFPFNIRFLVTGWNMLFFYPYDGVFKPDPNKSEVLNRGEYLVEGLAHCGMCHTPINFIGGPKRWLAYTGNTVDGWWAPNITGTNLESVTKDELVRVFMYSEKPGGRGKIRGPMREVNHDSLEYVDQSDLYAMAEYIKSTKDPIPEKKIEMTAQPVGDLALGENVYNARCAACHNVGAGGSPKITDASAWGARIKKGREVLYQNVFNGIGTMPARGLCNSEKDSGCDDNSMRAAVDYILSLQKEDDKDKKERVGMAPEPIKRARAEEIFNKTCSTCHVDGQLGAPRIGDRVQWTKRLKKGFDILTKNVIYGFAGTNAEGACIVERGGCHDCTDAEIIAVIKYILDESVPGKDFKLW
tara:strand:- start:1478 stop:3067 length:1590 start_codon:yes stop_codon:yes gene_type:complete